MLYLNEQHIHTLGIQWDEISRVILESLQLVRKNDYAQPLKPYLRYRDLGNRIIAMPAYAGGAINTAGLKWIASFPENLKSGIPRAHSVTVLNEADTGRPVCFINTTLISGIRTAAVSAVMIRNFLQWKSAVANSLKVGITGFGPIGQLHLDMLLSAFGGHVDKVLLYDVKKIDPERVNAIGRSKTFVCNSWQEVFTDADIFISCTVSGAPYVDLPPKKGSLQLNVSLRDFKPTCRQFMDYIIVDDWEEVCRENTDIENMHKLTGLTAADTYSFADAILTDTISARITQNSTVMFNPMGMAVFDIALGNYYFQAATSHSVGVKLEG